LAAGPHDSRGKFQFGIEGREAGNVDQRVGGVEANSNDIYDWDLAGHFRSTVSKRGRFAKQKAGDGGV